ncbi:hypothetical protein ACOMHN_038322 [Nucella lapillus]
MSRSQNFAIFILLSLGSVNGMYMGKYTLNETTTVCHIGGAPMMPQMGYPGPMQMGGAPFMGHHPNALMLAYHDYDPPDFHPAMLHAGYPAMAPMSFPGPAMAPKSFPGVPVQGPAMAPMSFPGLPAQGPAMAPAQGPLMHGHPGAMTMSRVVPGGGQIIQNPPLQHLPAVQSPPAMLQPQTVPMNPNLVQTRILAPSPQSHVNQVMPHSAGSVGHPSVVQTSQVAGQHGGTYPSAVPPRTTIPAQAPQGAVHAAQPTAVYPAVHQQQQQQQQQQRTVIQTHSHGTVNTRPQSVNAATMVQPGAINRNPAGVRVVQTQPGRGFAAWPQPGMPMVDVGGRVFGPRMMPMGPFGAMGLHVPFPRDGTYRTARGEYTRDGSDLSFDPHG